MLERKKMHLAELATHKKLLIDSCSKMAIFLLENNNEDMALNLMKRAFTHDISKLNKNEFDSITVFDSYNKSKQDHNTPFSKEELVFLSIHWVENRHHPEHWENICDMEEIDILEMVCDWHARSVEFGSNFLEYIVQRQQKRFSFPDDMYNKIIQYATILMT